MPDIRRERRKHTAPAAKHTAAAEDPRLRHIERLGYLLDQSIRIPVVGYRIGYDAIIGLIPGVGDLTGMALSAYIVLQATRFGVSRATVLRMLFNVGVEALVGAVPLLGDLFDAAWKANTRNLDLLHAHLGSSRRVRPASNRRFFGAIVAALALLTAGMGLLAFLAVRALVQGM